MPRAALLSLHARLERVDPSTWDLSVARPALGAALQRVRRPEGRLRGVLARAAPRAPRAGHGPSSMAFRVRDHLDGAPATDRETASPSASAQLVAVRRADGHARHPLGRCTGAGRLDRRRPRHRPGRRTPRARPALPPRLRAGHRRGVRPLGRRLRARRPARSPRSRVRWCGSARRSATSGSRTTSRPCAPEPRRSACAPAPERRRVLPAGRRRAGAARPVGGPAWAALDAPRLAGRAAGRRRDPRHLEAGGALVQIEDGRASRRRRATRSRRRPAHCRSQVSTARSRSSGSRLLQNERCAAGTCWAARCCVLGCARMAPHTNAPCVLASHHQARPVDERSSGRSL